MSVYFMYLFLYTNKVILHVFCSMCSVGPCVLSVAC